MRKNGISLYCIFVLIIAFSLYFVIQANAYIGGYPSYTYPYWTLYNYPLGIQNTYGSPRQYGLYGLYGGAWGLYGGAWGLYGGSAYPWRGLYGGAYPSWGLYGGLYGLGWW